MLQGIKAGYKAAKNFGRNTADIAKYADDAFNRSAGSFTSAKDAGAFYANRAKYMDDFTSSYLSANARPTYDTFGEQVGRGLAGVTDVAGKAGGAIMNNPIGQMALFTAPMLLTPGSPAPQQQMPMERQLTPEEAEYLMRQQQMQQQMYG